MTGGNDQTNEISALRVSTPYSPNRNESKTDLQKWQAV